MCVCVCVFVCVGRFRFRSRSRFLFTAIVVIDQRRVVVDASSRRVFSFQFCAGGVAFGHRQMMNLFVCFFFLFFLITKKRSIVVSMADRWRILATRNGKPLLFVFVLFPFFFCLLLVGTVAIDGDYRIERPGRKIARRRSECGAPIGRPSTTSTSAASAFDRRSYFLLFYCLGLPPIREREREREISETQ